MSANDPAPPPGERPDQPEAPRGEVAEVTEIVEIRPAGVAGPDVPQFDVAAEEAVVVAPPPPFEAFQPPQPAPAPQQPGYPAQPYPQAAYPHTQTPYAQPMPSPQPAYYGWGIPLPPPPSKPRVPGRTVATASVLVLAAVLALAGGVALARPSGGSSSQPSGGASASDEAVRALWRSVPANDLLPATLTREGTESYIRVGIDPDESCGTLPSAFTAALAPAACSRVLAATYVDRTQTVTATVGIVVIGGSAANRQRLFQTWSADANASKDAMMPHAYPVTGTLAAAYTDKQRVAWQSQVSTDGTYLVYAVAGFTDGRTGPDAAARAAGSGSALSNDSPPVQVAADLPAAIQNLLTAKLGSAPGGTS
jgi:hypothetical protein